MYKIAICDDNLFFIKQLRAMLEEKIRSDDQIEIYEYHSGEQLLMEMDHFFDVIFMDVVLPKRDGMSIAEELYRMNPLILLIYCSGTILPTTEAFQVQPYRYLLKQDMNKSWNQNIDDILQEMKLRNRKILKVMCEKEEKWIHSDNLLYVMTEGKYSKITFYENEGNKPNIKTITVRENIREIEREMDQESCYRVHRSVIVQFNYIVQIKNNILTMEDGQEIQISRMKVKKFHEKFSDYMGVKYRRESKGKGKKRNSFR